MTRGGCCQSCRSWKPLEHEPGMGECMQMSIYAWPAGFTFQLRPNSGPNEEDVLVTPELFGCNKYGAREA